MSRDTVGLFQILFFLFTPESQQILPLCPPKSVLPLVDRQTRRLTCGNGRFCRIKPNIQQCSCGVRAHLSEGQMKDGLRGQGLQVVLSGQSQGLQEEGQSRGEARRLPVELSGGQQDPVRHGGRADTFRNGFCSAGCGGGGM